MRPLPPVGPLSRHRRTAALLLTGAALAVSPLAGHADAQLPAEATAIAGCYTPLHTGGAAAKGGPGGDTRPVSAAEQAQIEARTAAILKAKAQRGIGVPRGPLAAATVPVYVHVMRDAAGNGDVTDQQISQQIAVLNQTFAGQESSAAANTGFTFTLAGTFRYNNNNNWHRDKQSATYRKQTRKGGANALNIWLVDFSYLGIATFPWDYARNPGIDGIRVHYDSLPGGSITNYKPRRDRDPRGRALVRAVPHVPGRLHDDERPGLGHPGAVQLHQRVPRGPRLLLAAGTGPHPQLHGLLLRLLLQPVHPGPEHADQPMWTAYRA
jgi:hypothetical protein